MSPPCVPFFEGDNGGATHQGVTREEVNVMVYTESSSTWFMGNRIEPSPVAGSYCDIDLAENTGGTGCYVDGEQRDHTLIRIARSFSRYFNSRYQTYGRHVHYWFFWGNVAPNEAVKRSEAADNHARLRPFAVVDQSTLTGYDDAYYQAVAARRSLLSASAGRSPPQMGESYRRIQPMLWGFVPDAEHWMQSFTSYICTKVAPFPVEHAVGGVGSDGGQMNGRTRRIGILHWDSPATPQFPFAAKLLSEGLRDCGVSVVSEEGYSSNEEATVTMAAMRRSDVTTVLIVGSGAASAGFLVAADAARWYPELVFAGDGQADTATFGQVLPPKSMANAWLMSYHIAAHRSDEQHGYQACLEGDPSLSTYCSIGSARYREHFVLFKLIQSAGPRLTPENVDRGMHAIPRKSSTSFEEAACYFDSNDYTCVKDATEQWWDGTAVSQAGAGCWRLVRKGTRFLPGEWLGSDDVFDNSSDPCNALVLG